MAAGHWFEIELNNGTVVQKRFMSSLGAKRYCSRYYVNDAAFVNFVDIDRATNIQRCTRLYAKKDGKWEPLFEK